MKKLFSLILLCAVCALPSCSTDEETIVYVDPTYDVSSVSLSESSLLFNVKKTGYQSETLTISAVGEDDIPVTAYYAASLDEAVATASINDDGELEITPVGGGSTKIVVSLQNKVVACAVEVRTTYFDLDFAQAIYDLDNSFVLGDDGDIDITTNAAAIAALTSLDVSNKGLTSLVGVEYLTALTKLNCYDNNITSLDLSKCVALEYLDCEGCLLTSLDVSGCAVLEELYCNTNLLTSINLSGCESLDYLNCSYNSLTSLDISDCTVLETLYCRENFITSLDVSMCTNLGVLYCYSNNLTSLDVTACGGLSNLSCGKQLSGTMILTLTSAQESGIWASQSSSIFNSDVTLSVVD
ncbi:MAG: leucine-rich repeat domain-containing protein [Rikenellaceae bacterium]